MSKKMFILSLSLFAVLVHAEMLESPDANTLWLENGQKIVSAPGNNYKSWNSALTFAELPGGKGFSVTSKPKTSGGRYVNVSPQYPWLVYEISEVQMFKGYRNFSMNFLNKEYGYGQISKVKPGIYVFNAYENSKLPASGTPFLRFDLYNCQLNFRYMKMVKQPDNFIRCESPAFKARKSYSAGDKLTFTVTLKNPAEDVTLSFYDSYCMRNFKLGKSCSLVLKPADQSGKIWKGELTAAEQPKKLKKNNIWIKADVISDAAMQPVWTVLPYDCK